MTYDYDEAGNLLSVTEWNDAETTYEYDDAGMLETATLANGVVGAYSYDNADRLEGISWEKGGVIAFVDYTLDAVGNRTQRVDGLGTHTYDYDNLYRITNADYPGADETDYTYDAVGNRKTMVIGAGTTSYTYDAADRLTLVDPPGAGSTSYTFDDNGNLTSRGSDSFSWDAEDRMTSATVSSTTTTFVYNGDGLRNSLTTGGNTTTFTWDVAASIPEVLEDGSFKYVYGLGRLAEVGPTTTTHYYLPDGLGSTMALVNSSGSVVNTYDYDVFGAIRSSTGSQANAFKYTGEQFDSSTGLQYLRARFYDIETGRFTGRDPLPGIVGVPGTQNNFSYAMNTPTMLIDPYGLFSLKKLVKKIAKPTILTLDAVAVSFSAASAVITDVATVGGCISGASYGASLGPAGLVGGCIAGGAAGYIAARVATRAFVAISYYASGLSAAVSCGDSLLNDFPPKEARAFFKSCVQPVLNFRLTTARSEPNWATAVDAYQFCLDLNIC